MFKRFFRKPAVVDQRDVMNNYVREVHAAAGNMHYPYESITGAITWRRVQDDTVPL